MTNTKLKGDGIEDESGGWIESEVGQLGSQIMFFYFLIIASFCKNLYRGFEEEHHTPCCIISEELR